MERKLMKHISGGTAACAVLFVAAVALVSAAPAASGKKAPRIVSAAMQDVDRDGRADRVRLVYSARIRHAADRDGRYPFTIAGYRLGPVGAASGKTLVILLAEKAQPDSNAQPRIRYRRTKSKPVTDRAGVQAVAQTLRARAHQFAPGTTPPPAGSPPAPPAAPPPPAQPAADSDRDGTRDGKDCAPKDAAIHPGALDLPDLGFVDSNCDGIDGDEQDAIFAAPDGNDVSPGTKAKPKRQIRAAVKAAATAGKKQVLAAAGTYERVLAESGIGIYGGYDAATWARRSNSTTLISAALEEGVLADAAQGVVLQLLSVRGTVEELTAYGIRAINGSRLTLQRVTVTAGNANAGGAGSNGRPGAKGEQGQKGWFGSCDHGTRPPVYPGGVGGSSPAGRPGGRGGNGYFGSVSGDPGSGGAGGTPGGKGGLGGNPGQNGTDGQRGVNGDAGAAQGGGSSSTGKATTTWAGEDGRPGKAGTPGAGGGGGGGGGGQGGVFAENGQGASGGGGGGGGAGGGGGEGGSWGGGSFGIYLHNSTLVAESSSIQAGNGGAGGNGGNGGVGGLGGRGGSGGRADCPDEVGFGGSGGRGGAGGPGGGGGGGAGGPSVGVFKVGTSSATLRDTTVAHGTPGRSGDGGGPGRRDDGQTGIASNVHPS
jgi:hypothetical protein